MILIPARLPPIGSLSRQRTLANATRIGGVHARRIVGDTRGGPSPPRLGGAMTTFRSKSAMSRRDVLTGVGLAVVTGVALTAGALPAEAATTDTGSTGLGWFDVTDTRWAGGAKGDGVTDDSPAINAAITAATPGGGTVFFPAGTYLCGSTITLPGGVHLVGSGVGGDIFSATDTELPYRGTVLRLKSASNVDLIKTVNFDGLTGSVKAAAYQTPGRFGLHNLALDGNKAGNRSGIPLRIFGKAYEIDHVVIQNGAAGGVYSEYGGGGYEMEARLTNFHITDNAGDGLVWKGPHDSLFVNGVVARNSGYNGINIVMGSCVGGEQFTNVHVWGSHSQAWVLGTQNASFTNCIADGAGVQVTGSGNCWIGGSILGTKTAGEVAITIGDGTTRTVSGNQFITRVYNYAKPAPLLRVLLNTTSFRNRWQISANMGGNIRYYTQGKSTLASSITLPASAIAVADASSFSPSGGTLYISDGTNIDAKVCYTGVTGNTLTGVTGGIASRAYASGSYVFSTPSTSAEWLEVVDPDNPSNGAWSTGQWNLPQFYLNPTSFNVGSQTLRPNSSATALQHIRNESGRVDLAWDNSGSAGAYSYQNGATVEGRKGTSVKTWRLKSATGAIQPGTAAGLGASLYSGSGAPVISATRGDIYFRSDSPSSAQKRVYICTGGTSWTGIL